MNNEEIIKELINTGLIDEEIIEDLRNESS